MPLAPGTKLDGYEILSPLGAGGMGEVYRALDATLKRDVAIKVLPAYVSQDIDRLRRFEQEAQAAAALNHPNILAVHRFGTFEGAPYMVSELLDGGTLGQLLTRGPLPVRKAIDYGAQIASGLAAAHEKGIVHRDLKPDNIFVTKDGRMKILDFGLAKLTEPNGAAADGATLAPEERTQPGMVLGTVGYMSPEQVRGKTADHRADIFAFGAILYEMLTGKRAFRKPTSTETMTAILNEDPPGISQIAPATPPALLPIVHRCLEKDPEQRFQSARDLGFALLTLQGDSGPTVAAAGGSVRTARPRAKPGRLLGMIALGLLLGGLASWLLLRSFGKARQIITSVSRLTHEPGLTEWPSWSPDGSMLAFASNRTGNFEIYVRRIEGGQEVNVTNDPGQDVQPSFSPDGTSIAFVSTRLSKTGLIKIGPYIRFEPRTYGGDVWVVPPLGGQPRRIAQDGNFPAWSPDGKRIAYVTGIEDHRSILEVPSDGGTPKTLLPTQDSHWEIARLKYSPKGNWMIFGTWEQRMFVMPAAGGTPREIFNGSSPTWDAAASRLYFLKQERLGGTSVQTVGFDEGTGTFRGEPQNVGLMTGLLLDAAVNRDGNTLVVSERLESLNLTRVALSADGGSTQGEEETLLSGEGVRDRYPAFSPDGKRVAFSSNRLGDTEVWLLDLATKHSERLRLPQTDMGANLPFWSPDGQRLAITRFLPGNTAAVWLASVNGSGAEEIVAAKPALYGGPFSPDGSRILYCYKAKDGFLQMFTLDLNSRQEQQLTSSPSDKYDPVWSTDGKQIAYSSNYGGSVQMWQIAASGGKEVQLTHGFDRLRHATYSPDGHWLYVQPNHLNVHRIPAGGGKLAPVTNFPEGELFMEEPRVSPDGRWLVYCRNHGGSSLWLLGLGSVK